MSIYMSEVSVTLELEQVEKVIRGAMIEMLEYPSGIPAKKLKAAERILEWFSTPSEWAEYKESSTADWRHLAQ